MSNNSKIRELLNDNRHVMSLIEGCSGWVVGISEDNELVFVSSGTGSPTSKIMNVTSFNHFSDITILKDMHSDLYTINSIDDPTYLVNNTEIRLNLKYNPNYGDDRMCECGDVYYRHFDTYAYMDPCGCKYCDCSYFVEAKDEDEL